ncbi:MAG: DUF6916 family protein [Acidimicrobiales bacterium]
MADQMSRRTFLYGSGAGALIALTPGLLARTSFVAAQPLLTRSRFAPALGGTFRLSGGGDNREVTLIEINDLLPVVHLQDEDRFALVFQASRGHPPVNGMRTFHHDAVGDVVLFVSPVGRSDTVVHYEAVINRL